jgi:hypothetical protein
VKNFSVWRGLLFACLVLLSGREARATDNDFQIWPVARINHRVHDDWQVSFMARGRFDEDASHAKDVMLRPYVTWTALEGLPLLDTLTVLAGYDYQKSNDGRDEHRPWQSAHHTVERDVIDLVHRVRLDERFVEGVDPVVFRLRYRISTRPRIGESGWFALASEEVLVNLNDGNEGPVDGFEQNRFRVGLGRYLFGTKLRAETGYEFQYAKRRTDPNTFRHVWFVELSLRTGER